MADKSVIMKEAQKYLAKGQIDKAIAEWEKLIQESPDGNTYNTIGDLYLKKNDKKNAVDSFHKAANFFRHEGFSLKSLALYKKVLNIDSTDHNALYALGELSEEKGITTDAVKNYLAAADNVVKSGKTDVAIEIYEKILSLSPANVPLRSKVAEILIKEGLKSDACKQYIFIADIYGEKGEFVKAKEYLQKVLDIHPLHKEAVIGLSTVYENSGNLRQASDQMKEAAALFPDDIEVIFRAAELAQKSGKTEDAKTYLRKVTENDPFHSGAKKLLGEIYLKAGDKEKAFQEYLPIIDGIILEDKYDDAVKLLELFKDVDPVETGQRLASIFKQQGEVRKASEALASVADAFLAQENKQDAESIYKEILEQDPDFEYAKEKIAGMAEPPAPPETEFIPPEEPGFMGTETPSAEEGGLETDHITIKTHKTADEIFTEADIFSRYGLIVESRKLLEELQKREPENIDLHLRLKNIYTELSALEEAVTECIILRELYLKTGDSPNAARVLSEAYEIYPDDPRLPEQAEVPKFGSAAPPHKAGSAPSLGKGSANRDEYSEEIAEAEFYARQGLTEEAVKIFEKLVGIFPEDSYFRERLDSLTSAEEPAATEPEFQPEEKPEPQMEEPEPETFEIEESVPEEEIFQEVQSRVPDPETAHPPDQLSTVAEEEAVSVPQDEEEYEDLSHMGEELVEAEEISEPKLDNDVLDIFNEFKKGLEQEIGDEDSETHYNLGIAYKEMGLVEDAIKAFQTARKDPKRFVQSSTMLGMCYMERSMYSLAIGALETALEKLPEKDDVYWAVKYDLAEAYEKNNATRDALSLYTEVYGWNANFREVTAKVNELGKKSADSAVKVKPAESTVKVKPKERKDRVSYL